MISCILSRCQFFIFASTCSASRSRSNLFPFLKHALVFIRIYTIAYGLGRTPLATCDFFSLCFFCNNNTKNWSNCATYCVEPLWLPRYAMFPLQLFFYKNSQFHLFVCRECVVVHESTFDYRFIFINHAGFLEHHLCALPSEVSQPF